MPNRSSPIRRLGPPFALLAAVAFVQWALRQLEPAWATQDFRLWLQVALVAAIGAAAVRTTSFVLFDVLFRGRKAREAPEILRVLVSIAGYTTLFVVVYGFVLNRDISGVLATSAIVTVILGLALQDTLGNFFAGLSLHVEQPYQIGDVIRVGEMLGRVESVTWRTTAMRTNDNSIYIVPNSRIAREPIEIYRVDNANRRLLRFPAPYGASPETVIALIREAVSTVPSAARLRPPAVRISQFDESRLIYEVLYWVNDYLMTQDIDAAMRERVWYALSRKGLGIPLPIRHVRIESDAAAPVDPSEYEQILASTSVFGPLGSQERLEIAKSGLRGVFAPGELVVRRGDAGGSMFIIIRGTAEVLLSGNSGNVQNLAVLRPGDVFGEMALFTGETRSADVKAVEELQVLEVRKPVIEALLRSNPGLIDTFSRIIGERQAHLADQAQAAGRQEAAVAHTMLQRIKRFFGLS
jgi:small-conductance mechanosensitive channel/CRP-like cAMP-binding protein